MTSSLGNPKPVVGPQTELNFDSRSKMGSSKSWSGVQKPEVARVCNFGTLVFFPQAVLCMHNKRQYSLLLILNLIG